MMSLARRTARGNNDDINIDTSTRRIIPKNIRKEGGGNGLRKKQLVPSRAVGAVLVAALVLLSVMMFNASLNSNFLKTAEEYSSGRAQILYKINITEDAKFSEECHAMIHTFEFKSGKVKWVNGGYSYLTRGLSTHCLLARAAKRLGPDFTLSMRITTADLDLNSTLAFGPAATDRQMEVNKVPPLLFPDSTFESWPEVNDFSLPKSVAKVRKAAAENGLPGSTKWIKRKPQLLWRGVDHGRERVEMINISLTSPLLDIQAVSYNMTEKGLRLKSLNKVSRDEHCQYRFLLHMNGIFNNRYSSALKWKLLCGSLVFVPVKPLFVEWWNYQTWKPHVHYVPYESSQDLLHKVEYYSRHLNEASSIAQRGMELAQTAFDELPRFIDKTLLRYYELTRHLPRKPCAAPRLGKDAGSEYEYKSLEDLKEEYGPNLCA
mmetsp:Transcript_2089/g.3067  ORF Transcript_2089/g.3067 Transcript_2089/m.3067 type:complete len:433 (-) Transcript_2089:119-1417(-)